MSNSEDYVLQVIQQPELAKVTAAKEKVRTPIDPPPVIELALQGTDPSRTFLHSPFFFGNIELESADPAKPLTQPQAALLGGNLVSSLHKVKLQDNRDHGLFIFGDLTVRVKGRFRLRFNLFEMHKGNNEDFHVVKLNSQLTVPFNVYAAKEFPGQMESTHLSKILCDSGIKLRIRKETSKRKAQSADWSADQSGAMSYLHRPGNTFNSGHVTSSLPAYLPGDEPSVKRARLSQSFGVGVTLEAEPRIVGPSQDMMARNQSGMGFQGSTMPSFAPVHPSFSATSASFDSVLPPIARGPNVNFPLLEYHLPQPSSQMLSQTYDFSLARRRSSPLHHRNTSSAEYHSPSLMPRPYLLPSDVQVTSISNHNASIPSYYPSTNLTAVNAPLEPRYAPHSMTLPSPSGVSQSGRPEAGMITSNRPFPSRNHHEQPRFSSNHAVPSHPPQTRSDRDGHNYRTMMQNA